MIKLGTNILSYTLQRHLGRTTDALATVSSRLSSGQRINKASDDAAGLAISSSLQTDTRIFTQGVRNLNDGASAVSIAESALGELDGILTRVQELATQSMSGSFSDTQRKSLQAEATALQSEWNRIVEGTTFNGANLLTGENTSMVLQGGKGVAGTLAVQIGESAVGTLTNQHTSSAGGLANGASAVVGMTSDGRYMAIYSAASNLVAGDLNGVSDVFVKDTITGATTLVSTTSAGVQGTSSADLPGAVRVISDDGRYVVFSSVSTNLVAGDTNAMRDIFIKDTQSGILQRVSTSSTGVQGDQLSSRPTISGDGRYVAFFSDSTNLVANDTNGDYDIFVKDLQTGSIVRASTDSNGNEVTGATAIPTLQLSADGRYVLFESDATNLVSGDTNGVNDIFVKDLVTGRTTRVNTSSSGAQTVLTSDDPRLSDDGRFVTFSSADSTLVSGDTNGVADIFVKNLETGEISRVSEGLGGIQGNGVSGRSSISGDGSLISFNSASTNLTADDTNGVEDIFIKDMRNGTVRRIGFSDSGAESNGNSTQGILSSDGRSIVFISSATNLTSGDTNGVDDVFLKDLTTLGVQKLTGVVVSNRQSASVTLRMVQGYRDEISDYRGKIGATMSRLASFRSVLESSRVNYEAANSRILDADVAEEVSQLVRLQISQNAATALLAQVNQAPAALLALLK